MSSLPCLLPRCASSRHWLIGVGSHYVLKSSAVELSAIIKTRKTQIHLRNLFPFRGRLIIQFNVPIVCRLFDGNRQNLEHCSQYLFHPETEHFAFQFTFVKLIGIRDFSHVTNFYFSTIALVCWFSKTWTDDYSYNRSWARPTSHFPSPKLLNSVFWCLPCEILLWCSLRRVSQRVEGAGRGRGSAWSPLSAIMRDEYASARAEPSTRL